MTRLHRLPCLWSGAKSLSLETENCPVIMSIGPFVEKAVSTIRLCSMLHHDLSSFRTLSTEDDMPQITPSMKALARLG